MFLTVYLFENRICIKKFKSHAADVKSPTWYIIYAVCCLSVSSFLLVFFFPLNNNCKKNLLRNIIFCIRQGHLECLKEHSKQNFFNSEIEEKIAIKKIPVQRRLCRNKKSTLNALNCFMFYTYF